MQTIANNFLLAQRVEMGDSLNFLPAPENSVGMRAQNSPYAAHTFALHFLAQPQSLP